MVSLDFIEDYSDGIKLLPIIPNIVKNKKQVGIWVVYVKTPTSGVYKEKNVSLNQPEPNLILPKKNFCLN